MALSFQLRSSIEDFLSQRDLGSLYKRYTWTTDTWEDGFSDMRELERDLSTSAAAGYLTRADIMRVVAWGRLRNKKRVECPERVAVSDFLGTPPSTALLRLRRVS